MSDRAQARLRVFGQAGENHRDVITCVLAARAGYDHAGAVEPTAVAWRSECHRHLRPGREGRGAAKFYAVFMDDDRVGRKGQAGLPHFDGDLLQRPGALNCSSAHIAYSNMRITHLPNPSN